MPVCGWFDLPPLEFVKAVNNIKPEDATPSISTSAIKSRLMSFLANQQLSPEVYELTLNHLADITRRPIKKPR